MKIFLSSVGWTLQAERDGLAAQLKVMAPYEPLRFEDFTAQGRSSREACLAGVDACDVYVLILGPRYGDEILDTGKAPTEEEFEHARRSGKPILVFTKTTDEPDHPRQTEFKARVENYVDGYFRGSFTDVLSLNIAVTAALQDLPQRVAPLTWADLDSPADIIWRWDVPQAAKTGSVPVLDAHLVPLSDGKLRAVQMEQLPAALTRAARDSGLFAETAAVDADSTATVAWSTSRTTDSSSSSNGIPVRYDRHQGIIVHRTGQVSVFESLPVDSMGALVNQHDLQKRLARLIVIAASHLTSHVVNAAVAASLGPLTMVYEGDPAIVGSRTSGSIRSGSPTAVMNPDRVVSISGLLSHPGDVAAEMAAEIIHTVREVR